MDGQVGRQDVVRMVGQVERIADIFCPMTRPVESRPVFDYSELTRGRSLNTDILIIEPNPRTIQTAILQNIYFHVYSISVLQRISSLY